MIVSALRMSSELVDIVREGYSQDSLYWDENEWTKDSRIVARDGHFFRLDLIYVPRNFEISL
jgi:gluconate kinase